MRAVFLVLGLLLLGQDAARGQEKSERLIDGKTITAWIDLLQSKDLSLRVRAITALNEAGPRAVAAVPALLRIFREKEPTLLQPLAALALSRIGPKAVPRLEKALMDEFPQVRAGAAVAIGLMGAAARSTQPLLTRLLKDRDRLVRTAAAGALEGIRPPARREPVFLDSPAEYDAGEFPPRETRLVVIRPGTPEINSLCDQLIEIDRELEVWDQALAKTFTRAFWRLLRRLEDAPKSNPAPYAP